MIKPTMIRTHPGYRVYLEFSDGTKEEINLSSLIDEGVFQAWKDPEFFSRGRIGDHREVRWSDEVELCAESLYLRLAGKAPDELFPALRCEQFHA